MSYATVDQYKARYTEDGVAGTPAEKEATIQALLNQASAEINSAAADGLHAIPIVVSDLASDTTIIAQWEELLAGHTMALARRLLPNAPDLTAQGDKQVEECDRFLDRLRAGHGLPVPAPSLAIATMIQTTGDVVAPSQRDVHWWHASRRGALPWGQKC